MMPAVWIMVTALATAGATAAKLHRKLIQIWLIFAVGSAPDAQKSSRLLAACSATDQSIPDEKLYRVAEQTAQLVAPTGARAW